MQYVFHSTGVVTRGGKIGCWCTYMHTKFIVFSGHRIPLKNWKSGFESRQDMSFYGDAMLLCRLTYIMCTGYVI
jgi:hypothetical protein